ncbi:hypothetical protein [Paraburkholderia tropica]|uniref:hypothetical protein n=1 Tax=Paraburkholderia tropica TaxID=92647 RepID=UPI0012EA760A|nr:hypothetical protein [Paraburkholderia tropica]MBB2981840.1 hypothetical protein [Paraburkholderia tropica]
MFRETDDAREIKGCDFSSQLSAFESGAERNCNGLSKSGISSAISRITISV